MRSSNQSSSIKPYQSTQYTNEWLRRFSKLTCLSTLFLIFAGAMVKSTNSGLAVPDWPLSYGMFFPPMVGGVFYEHGHRMVATVVGFFTLCLTIWLKIKEPRKWVRNLGYCALGTVILQGLLGGITVLYFLPTPVSVAHGALAQIFFVLTIIIAYSQSVERRTREFKPVESEAAFLKLTLYWIALIFVQLILGAIMRHTGSGLAIPDFPKMGGVWIPMLNNEMLKTINDWQFEQNYDPVTRAQMVIHLLHRAGALFILLLCCFLNYLGMRYYKSQKLVRNTIIWLDIFIILQIFLGSYTVLTQKAPQLTSYHVVTGAVILGISVLLFLRAAPTSCYKLKQQSFH